MNLNLPQHLTEVLLSIKLLQGSQTVIVVLKTEVFCNPANIAFSQQQAVGCHLQKCNVTAL
jgi:hypothetical protein